jgi:hypothetical protein
VNRATAVSSRDGLGLCAACDNLVGTAGVVTNEYVGGKWQRTRAFHARCYDGSAGPVIERPKTLLLTPEERAQRAQRISEGLAARKTALQP